MGGVRWCIRTHQRRVRVRAQDRSRVRTIVRARVRSKVRAIPRSTVLQLSLISCMLLVAHTYFLIAHTYFLIAHTYFLVSHTCFLRSLAAKHTAVFKLTGFSDKWVSSRT